MPVWIIAGEQSKGRGRSGRSWHSPRGNLYASLLLATQASTATATQLSFVAALAAYDTIASLISADRTPGLQLKWPNDALIDGAKVAGILLESVRAPNDTSLAVVLGVGINLSEKPAGADKPAGTLGLDSSAAPLAFEVLAARMEHWVRLWDEGRGFLAVRQAWLARAFALGEAISVNLNGTQIRGKFRGVDSGGALQIETQLGTVMTVTAGDVFLDGMR